jgi:putrescine aminotransferase
MNSTEATSAILDYRALPEIVPPELQEAVRLQLLDEYDIVNPALAQYFRATESNLVEWKTEGTFVYNHKGERYYDCLGAGGVFGLGFRHPHVIQSVKDQLDRVALSTRFAMAPATAALARKLIGHAPKGLEHVYFGNSGTEAMEAALKLARLTTGRSQLIGTDYGYHGMSIATLSVSGLELWRASTQGADDKSTTVVPFNNIAAMKKAIGPQTAAVCLEPVQWASGCEVARTEYLQEVRALCNQHGALLIYDEIQCGLGRCGKWWAHEYSGVAPDLLCVGKILSGGVMPISAVLYNDRVFEAELGRPLYNNSSYGGNPPACAAGLATLEVLENENLIERSRIHGERVNAEFAKLVQEYPQVVAGQRGIGLMTCIMMTQPHYGILLQDFVRDDFKILISSMMHMPEFVRISPPFISTDEQIGEMLSAIRQSVEKISKMNMGNVSRYFSDLQAKLNK